MNNLDKQYLDLLQDILDNGITKSDRTGTGTISVFGRQIRHKMSDGFPLLTTKKMYWKGIVTELLWFLRGDTNIRYLVENDCHIWDGDCYKAYEKWYNNANANSPFGEVSKLSKEQFIEAIKTDENFAEKFGELGPIYGAQWRAWGGYDKVASGWNHGAVTDYKEVAKHDQIKTLIDDLKTNPDSRRLMVNAWNVSDLESMTLPPCHFSFQVYTRELSFIERLNMLPYIKTDEINEDWLEKNNIPTRAISLMWNQRSVDAGLGLPFNIASYGLLLEIIAKAVNMVPDELIGNLGDCHIYLNHIDGIKGQLTREPFKLPTLKHMKTDEFYKSLGEDLSLITHLDPSDFSVENYLSHLAIKMPLSN
jgi:thymidylate synthase